MRRVGLGVLGLVLAWQVGAAPITPSRDDEVIERLPTVVVRTPARAAGTDPALALRDAGALLDAARRDGDPRLAGRALARLAHWHSDAQAPAELVLTLARVEQFLHQFEPARARLQALVQREPRQAQAWLMLATLHRVQGRYAESDAGCRALLGLRAEPYAQACSAENQALRGETDAARRTLHELIAAPANGPTRAWLLTTLAELEQRAGRAGASEQAWRRALQAGADHYTALGYADFLLEHARPREAWALLARAQRGDAALLRLAMAAQRAGLADAPALQAELRERFALADQRIGARGHERERALMALEIERDPAAALRAARLNVERQREPLDILLLARCAAAAGDAAGVRQARALATTMGLHDARLAAL